MTMLRPGTRLRQMAVRGRAMAGVSAWNPGDLLAFWRFDGDGTDSSGNARSVTVGSGTYETGLIGQCLVAGSGTFTGSIPAQNGYTLQFWFQPGADVEDSVQMIRLALPDLDFLRLQAFSRNGAECNISGSNTSYPTAVSTSDEWIHVVVTFSDSEEKLYVNGVLRDTQPQGESLAVSAVAMVADSATDATGTIDLAGVWNRALTASEIATLYNGGTGFDPTA